MSGFEGRCSGFDERKHVLDDGRYGRDEMRHMLDERRQSRRTARRIGKVRK